jgi:predicted nucleic acid-binding protein
MTALDTNILIYACDKSDLTRQRIALELIATATEGVLLWQVACEFIAASRKLKLQGFTVADAWERLADFLTIFPLILPSSRMFEKARILHTNDGWSFWDAMIVAACLDRGVTRLYSEDLPGRAVHGPLDIVNPFVRPA